MRHPLQIKTMQKYYVSILNKLYYSIIENKTSKIASPLPSLSQWRPVDHMLEVAVC